MGPQEHAFRAGVDVVIATPGRLLDHFRHAYAALRGARGAGARRGRSDARHGLPARHPPDAASSAGRASRRCSSRPRCRPRSPGCARDAEEPRDDHRGSALGAGRGDHAGGLPGGPRAEARPAARAAAAGRHRERARVHEDQAAREPAGRSARARGRARGADPRQPQPGPAHPGPGRASAPDATRRSSRPISPRAGSTWSRSGTSSTSTCPPPRTTTSTASAAPARAEATGDAFTFVAPDEEAALRTIERAVGKPLPRVLLPDFDYAEQKAASRGKASAARERAAHGAAKAGATRAAEAPRSERRCLGRSAASDAYPSTGTRPEHERGGARRGRKGPARGPRRFGRGSR